MTQKFQANSDISIVIPVLNESENIEPLYAKLKKVLSSELSLSSEIIFVDDGSNDDSWIKIKSLIEKDNNVRGIKLSRNFGHDIAIKAGLDHCNGSYTIVMDADLQHPPELLPKIMKIFYEEKPDIIMMKRTLNLSQSKLRRLLNKLYYLSFKYLTNIEIEEGISDFYAMNRNVLNVIKMFTQKNLFVRGILLSIGFKRVIFSYKASSRFSGKSKYDLKKLTKLTKNSFIGFTAFPLRVIELIGLILSILSFMYGIYSIIKTLLLGSIAGWASIITTVSFLNGTILLLLTIYIEYFLVAFEELKNIPVYIIEEDINLKNEKIKIGKN